MVGVAGLAGVVLVDFTNVPGLRVHRAGGRAWIDGLYSNEFVRRSGVGLPFTYPPISAILFTTLAVPWQHVVGNEFVWCALAVRWRAREDAPPLVQQAAASPPPET